MFQNPVFSQAAVLKKAVKKQNQKPIWIFIGKVYKKTANYDTVLVDGTEEYAAVFCGFKISHGSTGVSKKWLSLHRWFHYLVAISNAYRNGFYIF